MMHRLLLGLALGLVSFAAAPARGAPSLEVSTGTSAIDLYNEGVRLLRAKKLKAAQRKFAGALRQRVFARADNNLAYCLRLQGRKHYRRALKHYNRALRTNPALSQARWGRGVLLVKMQREKLAKKDLAALAELRSPLLSDLAWAIDHFGKEKSPDRLLGMSEPLSDDALDDPFEDEDLE